MENDSNNTPSVKKSSMGLDENLAALLSYVFGFITGIIFFVIEKDSQYVKFHAMQSTLISVVLFVATFILGFIPILGWMISLLLAPASLILWIILMIKAYKHTWFKLPVIGDIAEKQASEMKL